MASTGAAETSGDVIYATDLDLQAAAAKKTKAKGKKKEKKTTNKGKGTADEGVQYASIQGPVSDYYDAEQIDPADEVPE